MEYQDTYFLSYEEAYKVASEQNKMSQGYWLQVCYYDGEYVESDLINLIHMPIDNLAFNLASGKLRLPTTISFEGKDFSEDVKSLIEENFYKNLAVANELRAKFNQAFSIQAKQLELDFSETLRFYLVANTNTQVMQFAAKYIADIVEDHGYEVKVNYFYGIEDMNSLKDFVEFNPHITININHLANGFLSDQVYNFIWFQDPMPILFDHNPLEIRERDYVFSSQAFFDRALIAKGIPQEKIFRQYISTSQKEFYIDESVERENKIIFVGSYYDVDSKLLPMLKNNYELYQYLRTQIENGESLSKLNIQMAFNKFRQFFIEDGDNLNMTQQGMIRNIVVEWMCELDIGFTHELYGYKWDQCENQAVKDNYLGSVGKEDLNRVYNSSKYVLLASGQVINTQRLAEVVACGAIPVMYDSRDITEEKEHWDSEILYFKTKEELENILKENREPENTNLEELKTFFSYGRLVDKVAEVIKEDQSS